MFLRQSTVQTIRFGPFLDDTDFKTAETALTVAQADRQLSKDGAAFVQSGETGNSTHDTDGWYSDDLTAADTNTVGELWLQVVVTGALPVWARYWVIEEATYDALFGAAAAGFDSNQRVDVGEWLGVAPLALSSQRVQTSVAAMQASVLNAAAIATDAIQAAKIQDGALTAAKFAAGAFNAVWTVTTRLLTAGTNIVLAKGVGVTGFNDPTAAAIADDVWDEAASGHVGGGSFGEEVQLHALSSELPSEPPTVAAIADQVWDEAAAGHVAGGSFGEEVQLHALSSEVSGLNDPTSAAIADAVWDEALSGHAIAGSAGEALTDAAAGSLVGPGATSYVIEVDDGTDPIQGGGRLGQHGRRRRQRGRGAAADGLAG